MTAEQDDLPPDNAARLAIFDALSDPLSETPLVTPDELFERVIGRLRVLVPRELHIAGDRPYFDEKLQACIADGVIVEDQTSLQPALALAGTLPRIRYPDGQIRDYTPGLEPARERIERDNARLRDARFDVRLHLPSTADNPDGAAFHALLASMREHGFLKQFPIVRYNDDVVIDGRARVKAAAVLNLDVEYLKYGSGADNDRTAARRRDTPLNRVMLAVQSNMFRLTEEQTGSVYTKVAGVTRRDWAETLADLELTSRWRRSMPPPYNPVFEVKRLPFRAGDAPRIQVTSDGKVMLRSLVEAAGLSNYKINLLEEYVPIEEARSAFSGGRKAKFARAGDLITGIAGMQEERRGSRLKVDPEWDLARAWLLDNFSGERQPEG
jgi:hypothetical protein